MSILRALATYPPAEYLALITGPLSELFIYMGCAQVNELLE